MSKFPPTAEQSEAIDAFTHGRGNLVLEAAAGTGKTTTLKMLTESSPRTRFLYLAYNRAVADDARKTFGKNVMAVTAHGWAMRNLRGSGDPRVAAVMDRLNGRRQSNSKVAQALGIREAFKVSDEVMLQPNTLARITKQTVTNWCYSAAYELALEHVEIPTGVPDDAAAALRVKVLPWARKVWADATSRQGIMRTEHDHYLKLFALRRDRWEGLDTILLDEAQDSNAVVCNMITNQIGHGMRTVVVGDRYQSLYGWRGAVDAMGMFPADQTVRLTQSFRFGPAVAAEANKWLGALGSDMRLSGTPSLPTKIVETMDDPDAVLCRTNSAAMSELMAGIGAGRKVAIVGGGADIKRMAQGALDLKATGQTAHPDLCAFTSWGAVQDYVDDGGGDLKTFVKLIDEYTADGVIEAVDSAADEADSDLVVSTAHKSKGREWGRVQIGEDFPDGSGDDSDGPSRPEMMLAYVAVTRAKKELERGSLRWIDKLQTGDTSDTPSTEPAAAPQPAPAVERPPVTPGPVAQCNGQAPLFGPPPTVARTIELNLEAEHWDFLDLWSSVEGVAPSVVISEALALLVRTAEQEKMETGEKLWFLH